jgi:small-conductance mechanosensitive channel
MNGETQGAAGANGSSIAAWLHEVLDGWAPLVVFVVFIIAGFLLERFVLRALYEHAKRRGWTGWELFFEAIRGVALLLCAALGIYLDLLLFPFRSEQEQAANRALTIIVIWAVTVVAARISVRFVGAFAGEGEASRKKASLFKTVISATVYVIGALVALGFLGINIGPMLTALGVGGLAVGLALRDTLANFFSGLIIIASRRLRVGDYIRLENGREGFVSDITWLQTVIRDETNALIVVPNERLATGTYTNLSLPTEQTRAEVTVNVAYGNDPALVESEAREVAASVSEEFAPRAPAPAVRFTNATETGLTVSILFQVARPWELRRARHELYKRLLVRYRERGVALSSQPWATKSEELAPPSTDWSLPHSSKPEKDG